MSANAEAQTILRRIEIRHPLRARGMGPDRGTVMVYR
jgi:hypothetical protein